MQLENMDFIDDHLEIIKQKLNPEDGYYVADAIISNISDPDMPTLVQEILDLNGYEDEIMKEVLGIVVEIQHKALGVDEEE